MVFPVLTPLAAAAGAVQAGQPLFGSVWLALLAVFACIAGFLVLVALLGRWLAATHPEIPPRSVAAAATPAPISSITTALIAASVHTMLGERARIAALRLVPPAHPAPSVESLMQQWSMEGRRQIYSSHKVR